MPSIVVRRLKIVVNAVIVSSLALIVLSFIINNPYTDRLIRAIVHEKFSEKLNLELEFEAVSISLFPLGATVYGIKIDVESQFKSLPILQIPRLKIGLSWWDLFIGNKRIDLIEIQDMEFSWPPPSDFVGFLKETETHDYPAVQKTRKNSKTTWPDLEIPIHRLIAKNASIRARFGETLAESASKKSKGSTPKYFTSMTGTDVEISVGRGQRYEADISSKQSNIFYEDSAVLKDAEIHAELTLQGEKFFGNIVKLVSSQLHMSANIKGEVELNAKGTAAQSIEMVSKIDSKIGLSQLGHLLDLDDSRGDVFGKVEIKTNIPLETPDLISHEISGRLRTEAGRFYGYNINESSSKFRLEGEKVILSELILGKGKKTLASGKGQLELNEPLDFSFDLEPKNLALSDLLSIFDINFDIFDLNLSSDHLHLSGRGFPFTMNVNAPTILNSISSNSFATDPSKSEQSPSCLLQLGLRVDDKALHILEDSAKCSIHSEQAPNVAVPKPQIIAEDKKAILNYSGTFHFTDSLGLDLKIGTSKLPAAFASYFAGIPLAGSIDSMTRVYGPYDRVKIASEISGKKLYLDSMPLAHLDTSLVYVDNKLTWSQFRTSLQSGGSISSAQGTLIPENLILDLKTIEARNLDAKFIAGFFKLVNFDEQLSFSVANITGHWTSPLKTFAAGLGSIKASIAQVASGNEHLLDSIELNLERAKDSLKVLPLTATLGDTKIGAQVEIEAPTGPSSPNDKHTNKLYAAFGLKPEDRIKLSIRTLNSKVRGLMDIQRIPYASDSLKSIDMLGFLNLRGEFEGRLDRIQGRFDTELKSLSVLSSPMAPIFIKGLVDGEKLNMTLNHSGNALEGRLSVDIFSPGIPYDWYLKFRQFDIRALTTESFFKDPRNFAYLSGHWASKGHFNDWWNSTGELTIDELKAKYNQEVSGKNKSLSLHNVTTNKIIFDKNSWHLDKGKGIELKGDWMEVNIGLGATVVPHDIDVKFEGAVNASILETLSKEVESANGIARFSGGFEGSATAPSFKARIFSDENLDTGFLVGLPSIRPEFKDLEFDFAYADGILDILKLRAKKGLGTIMAKGQLNLNGPRQIESNLNLNLQKARVIYPVPYLNNFDTTLSGELQISGVRQPYLLAGDIRIDKARSTHKVDFVKEVINAIRQDSLVEASPSSLQDTYLALNVNILADKSIVIHNNNIQATLSSNLRLQGNESNVNILGQLDIDNGKFKYKQDFDITRGEIIFDDAVRINPKLDILAVADVRPYEVTVAVTETASNPVVELLVDPPTRENGDEISRLDSIILLSTGSLPSTETKSAEAGGVGISEVLNVVGSQSKVPFEKFSELFGANIIQVYPDVTIGENGTPALQLNGDLKLTENIDASLKYIVGSKYKAAVKVPVHGNISLTGSLEQNSEGDSNDNQGVNNGSVDLRFRFPIK